MRKSSTRFRLFKTVFLYAAYITFGISCSLLGPAIPDLREHLDITSEEMGIAASINSIVGTMGAMMTGLMMDRFQRYIDLILGMAYMVIAVPLLIIPTTTSYWIFVSAFIMQSIGSSACDQASNLILLNMWGQQTAPILGLHTCWSLGWAIGPFVIRPFLGPDRPDLSDIAENITTTAEPSGTIIQNNAESRIEVAYMIACGLVIMSCIGGFISQFKGLPKGMIVHLKPVESLKTLFTCRKKSEPDYGFTIFILVCFCLYYFLNACEDNFISMWLVTYAVDSNLHFTKKQAALLDAASKFSHLVGRIIMSVIALRVRVQIIIFVVVYGVLAALVCLAFLGTVYRPCLWIFSCLFMAFCAPKWPSGISWTNTYISISGSNYILINLGAGTGWMFMSWLNGWLFTHRSPNYVLYVPIIIGVLLCVQLIVMQIVASRHGARQQNVQGYNGEEMHKLVDSEEEEEVEHFSVL